MSGWTPGTGPGDQEPDPFERILDDDFVAGAEVCEPSAEERLREAARATRRADLQRRLREEAEREQLLAVRAAHARRRTNRTNRTKRVAGPLVVIALIAGVVIYTTGGGSRSDGAASSDTGAMVRPTDRPAPDTTAASEPLGAPPAAPDPAGPFEFVRTQPDGDRPVAWDPCRPLRYVVNPEGAPPGSEALLDAAIERTADATGLRFVAEGATDEKWSKAREPYQPERYGDRWAPALISWSTDDEVPVLAGYVAGVGGGTGVTDTDGTGVYVSGQTVLDSEDLGELLGQPGGRASVQGVIQHELGHLVGLDHVADRTQLMYSESDSTQSADWGSGDLAGLNQLGAGDCFPEL